MISIAPTRSGECGCCSERIERRIHAQCFPDRGGAQNCDRSSGADAKQARVAESGIHSHRHQRCEQSGLHRQLRDGRIGESLRHDDGRGCESRYQVGREAPRRPLFSGPTSMCNQISPLRDVVRLQAVEMYDAFMGQP